MVAPEATTQNPFAALLAGTPVPGSPMYTTTRLEAISTTTMLPAVESFAGSDDRLNWLGNGKAPAKANSTGVVAYRRAPLKAEESKEDYRAEVMAATSASRAVEEVMSK